MAMARGNSFFDFDKRFEVTTASPITTRHAKFGPPGAACVKTEMTSSHDRHPNLGVKPCALPAALPISRLRSLAFRQHGRRRGWRRMLLIS